MTPLLEQLRAKAKAATPGPWEVAQKNISRPWLVYEVKNGKGWLNGKSSVVPEYGRVAWPDSDGIATTGCGMTETPNASFIAACNPETVLKLLDALDVMGEALSKIAVPRSHVTDGSDTKEEYEELYDFWHAASSEKLDAAQKVLNRAKELLK